MQYGPLCEDAQTFPSTAYGLAKDTLRKALEQIRSKQPYILQWVRLFYLFGEGQNPNSLLAQLERAIKEGQEVFKMSRGDQLRDYMRVEDAAQRIASLLDHPDCHGVINCCSGNPISVRQIVEDRCTERGARIRLERGFYDYPSYEPLAFWGVPAKLKLLAETIEDGQ
jgi:dTDP-6-deoxy-L-talose 4-dehydrogenase (NAD+)